MTTTNSTTDSGVTDAMIEAYLRANDEYWQRADSMPTTDPSRWRPGSGTVKEATRESLAAALDQSRRAQGGGVAECTRSHPHENMDAMCELRTVIARLENEKARATPPSTSGGKEMTVSELKARLDRGEKWEPVDSQGSDAERLDWLTRHMSGKALREVGVVWSAWSPETARAAIDAAIAATAGRGEV